jgi:hypothetical protein
MEMLETMIEQSNAPSRSISQKVRGKLNAVVYKNSSLDEIKKIDAFINGTG